MSSRPAESEYSSPLLENKVAARVWEDPIAASFQHFQARKAQESIGAKEADSEGGEEGLAKTKMVDLRNILSKFPSLSKKASRFFICPVLLPGGSGQREQEVRTKTRTAVLGGFLTNDWVQQRKGIQYLAFPKGKYPVPIGLAAEHSPYSNSPKQKAIELDSEFLLPFEIVVSRRKNGLDQLEENSTSIAGVILWIDIDRLGEHWLRNLEVMLEGIGPLILEKVGVEKNVHLS